MTWWVVGALVEVAGVLTAIRAVLEVRTPQGAIAWAVSLVTFPWLAVPAYWVLGRSRFHGFVSARRASYLLTHPTARTFLNRLTERQLLAFPERDHPLVVEELARLPFTRGNDAELLRDGDATFASIFDGIDRAREYVLVQFFIIRDDATGRELKRRLLGRAAAGVRCYLLYDEVGCHTLPRRYLDELRAGGVQARAFHTTKGRANRFQINFRNHRKIVVVDGREAWVGGLNMGDEYRGLSPRFGPWRDTHVRVAGPVVQCIQVVFFEDWHWAAGEMLRLNWDPVEAPHHATRAILCLPSSPADTLETCTLFFMNAINQAQQRLWIASPYFVPDEQFLSALQLAALRGADVRVLIPNSVDHLLVWLSAWSYLEEVEKVGIRVFRYQPGFMHQKVLVVDDRYCSIGTANFDNRSFRLNFEVTLAFADREFTRQVTAMLEHDLAQAREVTVRDLKARGFWFRLAVRAARLTAPVQ